MGYIEEHRADAIDDSSFLDKVFNFFGIGIALYFIAQLYTWTSKDPIIKHTVKCKFCRKRISEKVCVPMRAQALEIPGG